MMVTECQEFPAMVTVEAERSAESPLDLHAAAWNLMIRQIWKAWVFTNHYLSRFQNHKWPFTNFIQGCFIQDCD